MELDLFPFQKFDNTFYPLDTFRTIKISGPDSQRFLNGQLTSDVSKLEIGCFQESARLDRGGRLKSFFILARAEEDVFYAIGGPSLVSFLCEDLEKYIIMDDVEIENENSTYQVNFMYGETREALFKGCWASLPANITKVNRSIGLKRLTDSDYKKIMLLRGGALLGLNTELDQLVTDTVLNLSAVSHDKGCYLGQETVSKIETRRGGAHFPILLEFSEDCPEFEDTIAVNGDKLGKYLAKTEINNKQYALASAVRKFRVDKKKINVGGGEAVIHYLPLGGEFDLSEYVEALYSSAVRFFHQEGASPALEKFKQILKLDPKHEDTLETIGVIYGQLGQYEKGIELMDDVLKANPDSVMAHTNKSLFYMKMGKIDEAEEEKAQATVKSFSFFGKEAEAKRIQEESLENERKELERREQMFLQVLELDPDDSLANFGMADISFKRQKYIEAKKYLVNVIANDDKYSVAYALLGKTYIKLGERQNAMNTLEKGIEVASSRGDLMPANEMQSLLNDLQS